MSGDSISIAYLSTTQVEPLQDTHENCGYYTTEATMERNPESSQLVLCESLSVQYKTSTCFDDAVQDQIISDLMEPTTLNPGTSTINNYYCIIMLLLHPSASQIITFNAP